jgi:dTMP kinase
VERILAGRANLKYYEAGMDLGLSENKVTSFRLFQQRIINEYDAMVDEFGLTVIDGTQPVEQQQKEVRALVRKILSGWKGLPNPLKPARRPAARRIVQISSQTNEGGEK